ncbi:MAG: DciA family protein [Candidatus Bruticola sp.]
MQQISSREFLKWLSVNNGQQEKISLLNLKLDWLKITGPAVAMNCSPCAIKIDHEREGQSYLLVVCANSSWSQELQLQQMTIVEKLGRKYKFQKIRTCVGKVQPFRREKTNRSEYNLEELKLSYNEQKNIDNASRCIEDKHLRKLFQIYLKTSLCANNKALQNGAKVCPKCGTATYSCGALCFNCRNEEETAVKEFLVSQFNSKFLVSKETVNETLIKNGFSPLKDYEFLNVKNALISQRRSEIWKEINNSPNRSPLSDSLKGSIAELISLISNKNFYQLTDKNLEVILHPRLAKIYMTDTIIHFPADEKKNI